MNSFPLINLLQNARDGNTFALSVVDYEHHEIHAGSHYYVEGTANLTDTEQFTAKFVAPSGKQAHLVWDIYATGQVEVLLYEDAVGGMAGGSTHTPINSNRNSTKAANLIFVSGPTTSTGVGTQLHNWVAGSTAKANIRADPGSANRSNEIILKEGSTHMGIIVSNVDNNYVTFRMSWYEHTPKTGLKVAD